ncbi:cytochrome aa3 quinol oxidase subunit III [Ornithinibacillus gellani]|uniref:cytochrome c oxidase subunit 3 n=1 Tax=Ornithinibacillus gellani TaxID=2293253 RepID=UPI000F4AA426|nr:cytochrome c oxidase subunit 3 [Ornithinibacillus gellani]TQS72112.1 cytochrome aa3 quinol oxidase subunit III [Ornithinibacillus gellani]
MTQGEIVIFKDKQLGFFIYLGVETIMFATLFATYMIFTPAEKGPHPADIFEWKTLLLSSFFLLSSSGTLMMSEKGLRSGRKGLLVLGLFITLLFGMTFLGLEILEFSSYLQQGYGTSASVFFGSFYVLVGLHAAHVAFGVGWMGMLFLQLGREKHAASFEQKHRIFSYYWHFVDVIWIGIMVIVYIPYLL